MKANKKDTEPLYGDTYWTISFMRTGNPVFEDIWIGNSMDKNRWLNGIVFNTEAEATKIVQHVHKMLGVTNSWSTC